VLAPTSLAEELFFLTTRLECTGAKGSWTGTGFFMSVADETSTAHVVLITNKHVLEGANEIVLSGPAEDPDNPGHRLPGQHGLLKRSNPTFMGHPDPLVDVAAMFFEDMAPGSEHRYYFAMLPGSMLNNANEFSELDALESVTFVGYPNSLYDTVNMTPLARRGSTATPPSLDYNGQPAFVIDASVFPGSSGSPVFVINGPGYADRRQHLIGAGRFILVGVLASVHFKSAIGHLIPTLEAAITTPSAFVFQQLLNLGIVYRTDAIATTVDSLFEARDLIRSRQT
jgi:hypothetical protein